MLIFLTNRLIFGKEDSFKAFQLKKKMLIFLTDRLIFGKEDSFKAFQLKKKKKLSMVLVNNSHLGALLT